MPDWYPTDRAARWYSCPPWELVANDPDGVWEAIALVAQNAEVEAEKHANRRTA